MRRILPYAAMAYYILALLSLASAIAGWLFIRSIDGWEAGFAAAVIAPWILGFSAVVVIVGIGLLILLRREEMPMGKMIIALFVGALPQIGFFIRITTL